MSKIKGAKNNPLAVVPLLGGVLLVLPVTIVHHTPSALNTQAVTTQLKNTIHPSVMVIFQSVEVLREYQTWSLNELKLLYLL